MYECRCDHGQNPIFFFFDFLIWWSSWHINLVKDILTCACICGCGHGL